MSRQSSLNKFQPLYGGGADDDDDHNNNNNNNNNTSTTPTSTAMKSEEEEQRRRQQQAEKAAALLDKFANENFGDNRQHTSTSGNDGGDGASSAATAASQVIVDNKAMHSALRQHEHDEEEQRKRQRPPPSYEERREFHEALIRDKGAEVPLIKPRYGPYRRNKESIRVSTHLTLGQNHDNASQLLTSGASHGTRPERMVVQCGVQHYVDELHFDSPYAMYRTKGGKIETRSVGWSTAGDFVVERNDVVLTSDYCYSDSDFSSSAAKGRRSPTAQQQQPRRQTSPQPAAASAAAAATGDRDGGEADAAAAASSEQATAAGAIVSGSSKRQQQLHVVSTRFDNALCMNPAAPKPREVVSDGELKAASRNLWRRKYPGVRCPKNKKIRNRLMNDYFVSEHSRPIQLTRAQENANKQRSANGNNRDNYDLSNAACGMVEDDALVTPSNVLSFKPEDLPSDFVRFAGMTEKQQQQVMQRHSAAHGLGPSAAYPLSGQQQQQQPGGGGVDPDSAEGRWSRLSQKLKQEMSHAMLNTDFMPHFVRDVELQVRDFLAKWHDYHMQQQRLNKKKHNNNSKQQQQQQQQEGEPDASAPVPAPEPFFDVLCRDGYGRLLTHCVAQFYLLSSQSHDRCLDESNNNSTSGKQQTTTASSSSSSSRRGGASGGGGNNSSNNNNNNNNNNREFQRVTRIALMSQTQQKPPVVPSATIVSLFFPSGLGSSRATSPDTSGFTTPVVAKGGRSPVIANPPAPSAVAVTQPSSKKKSSTGATPPVSPLTAPARTSGGGGKTSHKHTATTTGRSPKNSPQISPAIAPSSSSSTMPSRKGQPVAPSMPLMNLGGAAVPSFPSSSGGGRNRFSGLTFGGNASGDRVNVCCDDDDDDDDEGYEADRRGGGGGADRESTKRFRKRRTLQFSGVTRRAILPLFNGS